MALAYWKSLEVLAQLSQSMEELLAYFSQKFQQFTIWVGSDESSCIRRIHLKETKDEIILQLQIPDVTVADLDVQVTQETLLIRGKYNQNLSVEGYFSPGSFQSLIPLPQSVHPETVWANLKGEVLTLRLLKQGEIQRRRIKVKLAEAKENLNAAIVFQDAN